MPDHYLEIMPEFAGEVIFQIVSDLVHDGSCIVVLGHMHLVAIQKGAESIFLLVQRDIVQRVAILLVNDNSRSWKFLK